MVVISTWTSGCWTLIILAPSSWNLVILLTSITKLVGIAVCRIHLHIHFCNALSSPGNLFLAEVASRVLISSWLFLKVELLLLWLGILLLLVLTVYVVVLDTLHQVIDTPVVNIRAVLCKNKL